MIYATDVRTFMCSVPPGTEIFFLPSHGLDKINTLKEGVLPYINYIICAAPKGMVFESFWSGKRLLPFWSESLETVIESKKQMGKGV